MGNAAHFGKHETHFGKTDMVFDTHPSGMRTPPRFDSPVHPGFGTYPPRPFQQHKQERTKEEVAETEGCEEIRDRAKMLIVGSPTATWGTSPYGLLSSGNPNYQAF